MFTEYEQLCLEASECGIELDDVVHKLAALERHKAQYTDGIMPAEVAQLAKDLFGEEDVSLESVGGMVIDTAKLVGKKIMELIKKFIDYILKLVKYNNKEVSALLAAMAEKRDTVDEAARRSKVLPNKDDVYKLLQAAAYMNSGLLTLPEAIVNGKQNDAIDGLGMYNLGIVNGKLTTTSGGTTASDYLKGGAKVNGITHINKAMAELKGQRAAENDWTVKTLEDILAKVMMVNREAAKLSKTAVMNKIVAMSDKVASGSGTLDKKDLQATAAQAFGVHTALLTYINRDLLRVIKHVVTGA